jgi:phosphoribosylamine---glycine ligase
VPGAQQVVVEDCLDGVECSVLALSDGERVSLMPPARDYKRLADGDRGPNTGGMGGYTWPSYATPDLLADIAGRILQPTVAAMAALGASYRGVLYAGLMLTADGPMLLEYNCRFGDPECELILPLLEGNLADVLWQVANGTLRVNDVPWRRERTYGVVLAAAGYPDAPRRGDPIAGLGSIGDDVHVFHAGTARDGDVLVTSGGRVLTLVGTSRQAVYGAVDRVHFEGKQFRHDIGELERVASA